MSFDLSTLIAPAAAGAVGWLVLRAIRGIDQGQAELKAMVAELVKADTMIQVELAQLKVRVLHLEHLIGMRKGDVQP